MISPNLTSPSAIPSAGAQPAKKLRRDFEQSLLKSIEGMMGRPGTVQHEKMTEALSSVTNPETGKIDLSKLPAKINKDLVQLQEAAEGFEGIFVKSLLTQMRKSSIAEKPGPYGELAQDLFDQAMADQTSKSPQGLGIASNTFESTAPRLVREAAGQLLVRAAKERSANELPRN